MNTSNVVKWAGLLGAFLIGGTTIMHGDTLNGIGIISAALGSAGVIPTPAK